MSDISRDGVVLSERPWWQDYFGVTACAHCGRSDGLRLGIQGAVYTVIACDCNYQHIRASLRVQTRPTLTVIGGGLT